MQRSVIVSFDMEPDTGSWTSDYHGMREGTPRILEILAARGIPASFMFTGREALAFPGLVEQISAAGHEIGCHTMYHETLGDAVFSMPGDALILDSEIPGRIALATETVTRVAGRRPRSFRAPRLFGSSTLIQALADQGYIADSSLPAYFVGRSFVPYRPAADDWTAPGNLPLAEVPVFYDVEVTAGEEKQRSRDQWPMLRLKGGKWFIDLCRRMDAYLCAQRLEAPLVLYLHPWEFVATPETIQTDEARITFKPFLHRNTGEFALQALDQVIAALQDMGARFETLEGYAEHWLSEHPV
ncbi:MAG: polysaccharide deacetylase family protein [Chloroflexi bacterium]|nr:polysaccharide deacetylase family protein [Chloroflexota bacterium]